MVKEASLDAATKATTTTNKIMKKQSEFKLFGYAFDDDQLLKIKEITFQTDAKGLRSFAAFFLHVAELMDQHGTDFGHRHYNDWINSRAKPSKTSDVIVARLK